MTVFAYIDDWGEWKVSHRPPENCAYLMIALSEGASLPVFISEVGSEVEVTP